jgi:inosine/xanthosine triphosphate pyrophosphatase family protein
MSVEEKNAISHRARAAAAAAPVLRRLLGTCDGGAYDAG